jgi:hypothetical protein
MHHQRRYSQIQKVLPETMVHIYQTIPYVTSHMGFFIVTAQRTANLTFFTFVPFVLGQVPVLAGSHECGTEPLGFLHLSFSRPLLQVHVFKTDFSQDPFIL